MHAKNDDSRWRSDGYIFFFSFSVAHHRFFANITKNICTLQRKHSENKFQHCFCCCPHINIYVCWWMLDIEHRKMSIAVVVATALCIWHKSASEHLHTYHAGALHCHDDIAYDDFACYSIVVVLALPRTRCGGGVNLASMGLMCVCEWRAECQILRVVEVFRQTQLDNSVTSVGARDPKEISSTVINIRYLSRLLDTWHAIVDGGYFFFHFCSSWLYWRECFCVIGDLIWFECSNFGAFNCNVRKQMVILSSKFRTEKCLIIFNAPFSRHRYNLYRKLSPQSFLHEFPSHISIHLFSLIYINMP